MISININVFNKKYWWNNNNYNKLQEEKKPQTARKSTILLNITFSIREENIVKIDDKYIQTHKHQPLTHTYTKNSKIKFLSHSIIWLKTNTKYRFIRMVEIELGETSTNEGKTNGCRGRRGTIDDANKHTIEANFSNETAKEKRITDMLFDLDFGVNRKRNPHNNSKEATTTTTKIKFASFCIG